LLDGAVQKRGLTVRRQLAEDNAFDGDSNQLAKNGPGAVALAELLAR